MSYINIREEELKNKIAQDYFSDFDCTKMLGNIDFCVQFLTRSRKQIPPYEVEFLLWAEAKKGKSEIVSSIVQLILTIGKARTFAIHLPPPFLAAFDAEKIAFIPYNDIQEIFYQNDFNWNVTPSNHKTREFKQTYEKVKSTMQQKSLLFFFGKDDKELKEFIKSNFVAGKSGTSKIRIDKNNFITIYNKWLNTVKPNIIVKWEAAKKKNLMAGDFYLADLLSKENETLKEKLHVLLKKDHYELPTKLDEIGLFIHKQTFFTDKQKAHTKFWNRYERPPNEVYWDYIVKRRDLLVPQDVRERKGSFFTPQIWVEFSQKYLADTLGDNWQDEHYIWDCAAGTGNLLSGLTNKYHIWASTLDKQDVDVMKDRIKNGTNLLETNVFQFDFLNDDFSQLPKGLQDIINDEEKRKKLIVYINPPYAEVSSKAIKGKVGVNQTNIHEKYSHILGTAGRELYAQFLIRIYAEISDCMIAEFSTLKTLQGSAFEKFRLFFKAKLETCFVVPANTFDNVKGRFPIGFKVWDTKVKDNFTKIEADIFNKKGEQKGSKIFYSYSKKEYINSWISIYKTNADNAIGFMDGINGNDFQHNNIVYILNKKEQVPNPRGIWINKDNLIPVSIYLAVRKCLSATWLNDRDQFLQPNEKWQDDSEFQNDCLAYTIFKNKIQSEYSTNHWIPFTEYEVDAKSKFESNFMTRFIAGKIKSEKNGALFEEKISKQKTPLVFSAEAKAVFEAGKALWKYYHAQPSYTADNLLYEYYGKPAYNANASLYDIRSHFQGRNARGRMNSKSDDEIYMSHITELREKLGLLANKIAEKVFEYRFLKS